MRRPLLYGIAILLSVFMFSCGGGDDGGAGPTNDYIRIDNNVNSISLAAADEQRKISVYSNCNWSVTITASDWDLKLDRYEGSGDVDIWLSTDPNTTTANRSATLVFKSQGITKTLTVTQLPGDLSLTVSPSSWEIGADGDSREFIIRGNSAWKVTSKPDWCEIIGNSEGAAGESRLSVKAGENPNTTTRLGQIVISGEKTITIDISQEGKNYLLELGTDNVTVDALGGENNAKTFTLKCNGGWTSSISHVGGGSWCSVTPSYGGTTGGDAINIKIVCQPNYSLVSREAIVKIVAGNNAMKGEVKVIQQAATVPVFSGIPSTREISKTEWEVSVSFTSMFNVTEYGFCLGTSPNPTTRYKVEGGGFSGEIKRTLSVEEGKTYYVRAYAVTPVGNKIEYGEEISFNTNGLKPKNDDNVSPSL